MRAPAPLTAAVTLAALLVALLAGSVLGVKLGERASRPEEQTVTVADPAQLAGTPEGALRSAGGFTGFGGLPALPGEVLRAGTVVEATPGNLAIAGDGSTTSVRYSAPARLFRIEPQAVPLDAGDTVVVRLVRGAPTAVLRVPPDLEEGAGSGQP